MFRTRRAFPGRLNRGGPSTPLVMVGSLVFRALYDFEVHRVDLPLPGLPRALDGLTIAQLSDLHAGSFPSARPMRDVVETVHALQPDLIAITGDYVNRDDAEFATVAPALRALQAPLGVYGCLGNHDHYAHVRRVAGRVQATSVDLLVNEHRTFEIDGARLHLIGTDNTGFNQHFANLPHAVRGLAAGPHGEDVRVLLAHDPTFWDDVVRPRHPEIDVMLCGHTHGGQIGFELGNVRWGLARIAYERWAGLYCEPSPTRRGRQFLYVNRGVGTVGPPLRIGIRPEITLLTLRPGNGG